MSRDHPTFCKTCGKMNDGGDFFPDEIDCRCPPKERHWAAPPEGMGKALNRPSPIWEILENEIVRSGFFWVTSGQVAHAEATFGNYEDFKKAWERAPFGTTFTFSKTRPPSTSE